ncbi:ribosome-binding factor A [Candidatus Shikimatogenerans bostrichidophilus]|uniref:ribosome-binding factor A n=1 Tax=Candidatus Shikimatogenerans bostrichidophilus TaxID=2943807 RepID=UPI00296779B3
MIKQIKTLKQKRYSNLINYFFNKLFIVDNKFKNILISVVYVYINKNYSYSNIYISIYPNKYKNEIFNKIKNKKNYYKKKLSIFLKNKFIIPELNFSLSNKKIFN